MHHSLFPLDSPESHLVSDEEFHLFHSIDRSLYTTLVHHLFRDPVESVQIMAFWMWLERETCQTKLIKRMLSLPPPILNRVANETWICLKCVEHEMFQFVDENGNGVEIRLLRDLLRNQAITLFFFHQHRISVLRGVSKIINTVCARAFKDILKPMANVNQTSSPQKMEMDPSLSRNNSGGEGEQEVSPDDRTVFLTFSKGYPITEDEVKEFFTRRFGEDLIEDLIMQEVGEYEQVLYAKMVVRWPALIGIIVRGNKAKYSINGKHVWARKYVKRHQPMIQTGSSSSSSSSSSFEQGQQVPGFSKSSVVVLSNSQSNEKVSSGLVVFSKNCSDLSALC